MIHLFTVEKSSEVASAEELTYCLDGKKIGTGASGVIKLKNMAFAPGTVIIVGSIVAPPNSQTIDIIDNTLGQVWENWRDRGYVLWYSGEGALSDVKWPMDGGKVHFLDWIDLPDDCDPEHVPVYFDGVCLGTGTSAVAKLHQVELENDAIVFWSQPIVLPEGSLPLALPPNGYVDILEEWERRGVTMWDGVSQAQVDRADLLRESLEQSIRRGSRRRGGLGVANQRDSSDKTPADKAAEE
ncbi:MAG: hypothetical protein JW909_01895 [Planctomycetes bacterium]|nr:hypothetical protein [Planctomycetota bacterium]